VGLYFRCNHFPKVATLLAASNRAAVMKFSRRTSRSGCSYELLFLAHLMEQAACALDAGDAATAASALEAARTFFAAHPQQWAIFFIERLAQRARTDYYRGLASLLEGGMKVLAPLLDDYLAILAETQA
jgi:hypothetical protein